MFPLLFSVRFQSLSQSSLVPCLQRSHLGAVTTHLKVNVPPSRSHLAFLQWQLERGAFSLEREREKNSRERRREETLAEIASLVGRNSHQDTPPNAYATRNTYKT